MNSHLKISAVVTAMALLIPAAAVAKRPDVKPSKGNKHGQFAPKKTKTPKVKVATANVKGVVTANDGTTMTVTVDKASGHAKACKGLSLTFDVSEARFHTADNDADADMDAADVLVGHAVKVRAKIAATKGRKLTCDSEGQTISAKAVHNRTTPQVEDEAEGTDEDETVDEEPVVDETDEEVDETDEEVVDETDDEVVDGTDDEAVEETDEV